jgi:hypothetical protein
MNSVAKIVEVLGLLLAGVILIGWWWNNRDYRRRFPPEKEAAERKALELRLLSPDWAFYEQYLERPAPPALRELFADRALVTSCSLELSKSCGIITFNPLDKDSLLDTADLFGFDVVPFATGGCGDAIFLRPGKSEPDTVFIAYHDDPAQGLVVLADSVAAMVGSLRKAIDVA